MNSFGRLWAGGFAAAFIALFLMLGGLDGARLLVDHTQTTGVIVGWEPSNHNSVIVEFDAYGQRETVTAPYPGSDQPLIGANRPVYYLPSDPQVASVAAPITTFSSGLVGVAVAAAVFSFAVALLVRRLPRAPAV